MNSSSRKLTERKGLTPCADPHRGAFCRSGRPGCRRPTGGENGLSPEKLIERQLRNADQALGTRASTGGERRSVTTYDLAMLNVETPFEIPRIVQALKAAATAACVLWRARHRQDALAGEHIAALGGRSSSSRPAT